MVLGQLPPRKIAPTLILTLTLIQTLTLHGGQFSRHLYNDFFKMVILPYISFYLSNSTETFGILG